MNESKSKLPFLVRLANGLAAKLSPQDILLRPFPSRRSAICAAAYCISMG
jgi:hypothetical protein